ncbi:MAG: rod shape-determining protein [Bryobacterales bacterium]|nr:rod shape-determining protein [Bryobacterales bacterium]
MIGFPRTRIGLDPGTANTLLYVKGRGVAVNEPSLVTIHADSGHIEAVGEQAEANRGRTPLKYETARPIQGGTVSNLDLFDGMLDRFLQKAELRGPLQRLEVVVAAPSGMTEVERLAVVESLRKAGAADVMLVDQVLAAARGAGLAVEESRGRMVVNIGAGVTDVAILSLGNTVYSRATRVAGDDMDAAIVGHIRATHQLIIGERTAERLKMKIGSAIPDTRELSLPVTGRCISKGLPREVAIRSSEIREAIAASLERIRNAIREALEQTPPELSADLVETGIVLTGGVALLRNLDRFISSDCGLPVRVAETPLASVIHGLAYQLDRLRASDWRRFGNGG